MPLVRKCARDDCSVLTMGEYCLEHELQMEGLDAPLTSEADAADLSPERRGPEVTTIVGATEPPSRTSEGWHPARG